MSDFTMPFFESNVKVSITVVDEYSRFDSAVALPEKSFQYCYTLINLSKSEVNIDTEKSMLSQL
jgi:hypothetical protein